MASIFFTIKQGSTTKKIKASNFRELCVKTSNSFGVNPNTMQLKFEDPSGEKLDLDSEDTYEFIEQLLEEQGSKSSGWSLVIKLSSSDAGGSSATRASVNSGSLKSQTSSVSNKSILDAQHKAVSSNNAAQVESKQIFVRG